MTATCAYVWVYCDVIAGGTGSSNALFGDAVWMTAQAVGGNDTLYGGASAAEALRGDAAEMFDSARGGAVLPLVARLLGIDFADMVS